MIDKGVGSPGEGDVGDDEHLEFREQPGLTLRVDDARIVPDFSVGSLGVGPVMGFGSDDFFPSAPYADAVPDNARAGGVE